MASSSNDFSSGATRGLATPAVGNRPTSVVRVARALRAHGQSDVGLVRKRNEDAFYVDAERGFAVVADGMGGAPAGELASRLAVDAAVGKLASAVSDPAIHTPEGLVDACSDALRAAETEVTREGRENPINRGLGCTLTILLLDSDRTHFAVAHVGDSRIYRLRDGVLEQLSRDHTLAQESVDEGRLPPDAVRHHPFGHILTRVVGMEGEVEAQFETGEVRKGDGFFLCTDGVIRVLEEPEIEEILSQTSDLADATRRIIEDANDRGGPDNSTVVLLDLGTSDSA